MGLRQARAAAGSEELGLCRFESGRGVGGLCQGLLRLMTYLAGDACQPSAQPGAVGTWSADEMGGGEWQSPHCPHPTGCGLRGGREFISRGDTCLLPWTVLLEEGAG